MLFSATFLPIQYYKALLGGEEKDYEVYANSVFDPEKRGLFIANDVTSKYTRRSEEEFIKIARYIQQIVTKRHGNYMVFCPSYAFLEEVYGVFQEYFATEEMDCVLQSDVMNEADREEFLHLFEGNADLDIENALNFEISYEEDRYLIGFCVLGGIFSEGIDLKIANLAADGQILQYARDMARDILNEDPELLSEPNRILNERLKNLFAKKVNWGMIS